MKEVFFILGILIEGSGFEEIVSEYFSQVFQHQGPWTASYQDHITIDAGKYTDTFQKH